MSTSKKQKTSTTPSEWTLHSKLVSAIALRDVLEKIQQNRAEFTAMGKSDPQAGIYSEKLSALTPEINRLSEEVRKERVAHVRDQLKAQLPELSEIQTQVRQKPPSSLAEWQQRYESLAKYSTLLGERQRLLIESEERERSTITRRLQVHERERAEIETVQKALEQWPSAARTC